MSPRGRRGIVWAAAALAVFVLLIWNRSHGTEDSATSSGFTTAVPSASAPPSTAPTWSSTPRPSVTRAATDATDGASALPWIDVSRLPAQAWEVLEDIDAGGPFAYPGKDGSTFGNFERLLPTEPRGYYREYTVATPGASNRGTRRIITGDGGQLYWTADHYEHFARIRR